MESGSSGEDCHIKCTYQDCGLSFPTEKLMKRHKVGGHDFYCKKCDVDCEDYEKELHHRLTARSESGKRMHIACAVCGLKLKSMDGLDDHRRKIHPVPQEIVCPWCNITFPKAGAYIRHFETSKCVPSETGTGFTADELHRNVEYGRRVHEATKDPLVWDGVPSADPEAVPSLPGTRNINEQLNTNTRHSCPGCNKHFKTLSALVSHSESSAKCGIKDRANYGRELGRMTGGILRSERVLDERTVEEGGPQALSEMVNKIQGVRLDEGGRA